MLVSSCLLIPSVRYGIGFTFVALGVSFAIFSFSNTFHKMHLFIGAWIDIFVGCWIARPSNDISHTWAFVHMADNVIDCVCTVVFHTFLAHFPLSLIALCSISLVVRVITVAIRRSASVVPMGKSTVENSAGSPVGYSDWYEALVPVADTSISYCGTTDARSDDIVSGMLVCLPQRLSRFMSRMRGCSMVPACKGVF